jgi:hypothetical protein
VLLFIYTGVNKLADFPEFFSLIRNQPLPQWMNKIVTWILPALELLIAALLMAGKFRELGLLLAFFTMEAFTICVTYYNKYIFIYTLLMCRNIQMDELEYTPGCKHHFYSARIYRLSPATKVNLLNQARRYTAVSRPDQPTQGNAENLKESKQVLERSKTF